MDYPLNRKKHSILGLIPLFEAIESQGGNPKQLLAQFDLSLDSMTGGAVIDQTLELDIVSAAMDVLDDPLLGVKVGSQVSFTAYGTYAMLLMTGPTFIESSRASIQFQTLSLLFSQMSMHMENDSFVIRYTFPEASLALKHFMADRDMTGTYLFFREMFEDPKKLFIGAGTARPKPRGKYEEEYRRYVDFDIEFDQPFNWFRLPISLLRRAPKHANELAHKLYRVQAHELMRSLYPDEDDIVAQTKQLLEGYQGDFPSISQAAKMCGTSERTLRRKLSLSNKTYKGLIDEHRKKVATDMLARKDVRVHELAEALGYKESASFMKAFRRWYHCTPRQFQKTLKNT